MTARVISLSSKANEIEKTTRELDETAKRDLLEFLDSLRKDVESGEIITLFSVSVTRDNVVDIGVSMDPRTDPFQVQGALDRAKSYLNDCFE